jgi:hypothetical protein
LAQRSLRSAESGRAHCFISSFIATALGFEHTQKFQKRNFWCTARAKLSGESGRAHTFYRPYLNMLKNFVFGTALTAFG